jgi:GntP family gluconate:H+ symporter
MNAIPGLHPESGLLLCAALAVLGLITLIARFKLNSFVALILAALFVGLCSGMKLPAIAAGFQEGVGRLLGDIAMVIGLGTVLGKLLAESGGAEVVARAIIGALGPRRLHWAMMLIAFIVGLPVFFGVGLVLLVPILYTLVRETKTPLLHLGIPLVAGLSVSHTLVPPHPGPLAAIGILQADMGTTIFYSLVVGLPTAIILGPLLGRRLSGKIDVGLPPLAQQLTPKAPAANLPGFGLTLLTILLPVLLMLLATVADLALPPESRARAWCDLLGSPLVAMVLSVLLALWTFGWARGFRRDQLLRFSEECLGPVASVLLIVGAGAGFGRVLVTSGVAKVIGDWTQSVHLSPLLLAWVVAVLIRIAAGSATVAITTAAGIVAPIAQATPGTNLELLVVALGGGSSIFSHLNDGGFWFVKEYYGLTVPQTLKSWSVMTTIKALLVLAFVLALDRFV